MTILLYLLRTAVVVGDRRKKMETGAGRLSYDSCTYETLPV